MVSSSGEPPDTACEILRVFVVFAEIVENSLHKPSQVLSSTYGAVIQTDDIFTALRADLKFPATNFFESS